MQSLCKNQPEVVGPILSKQTEFFTAFFRNHPDRIQKWFDHFHFTGKTELGATALEHYAFIHRDWFWTKHMIWRSARPVSPIIAAQQRQLLMHLDVQATISEYVFSLCFSIACLLAWFRFSAFLTFGFVLWYEGYCEGTHHFGRLLNGRSRW
jgi:hypothetical protein